MYQVRLYILTFVVLFLSVVSWLISSVVTYKKPESKKKIQILKRG